MADENWERKVLQAGIAWIAAGALALVIGLYVAPPPICNCPAIPSNATAAQITNICPCAGANSGYIYVGAIAIIAGFCIVLFRRRIAGYAMRIIEKSRMPKQ